MRTLWVLGLALWVAGVAGCGSSAPADGGDGDVPTDVPDGGADVGLACRSVEDCKALDAGPCGRVACSEAGVCRIDPAGDRDGTACDSDDRCAVGGATCHSGTCVPASRKSCLDRPCLAGRCDAVSGECRYESLADGQGCEVDGNACTADQCVGGTCQAGANTCECSKDAECPVPANKCLAALRCDLGSHRCVPSVDGARCPQPSDPCRVATCDEATGACSERSLPDQTECEPSSACNGVGTCAGGTCRRQFRCADDDPCTEDRCDPSSGECTFPPSTGGPCSDGDPCTVDDTCAEGACVPGTARDCDDGNPCTEDACLPGTECTSTPLDPATTCDDGDRCTTGDACGVEGTCAGLPVSCDDGNACTRDSCDGATGACVREPLDGSGCDDGHACTAGDACRVGECVAGTWVRDCCESDADCDDGDACTVEHCDGGTCAWGDEPVGVCDGLGGPCTPAWCSATTGGCEILDARLPRRLVAWDLRAGGSPQGFRWNGGTGERRAEGAGPASGAAGASFPLPGRRLPAGLAVLVLDLGATACGKVHLYRDQALFAPAECRRVDGRNRAAWSWPTTGASLDLTVRLDPEAVVSNVDLYLWAQGDCPPLGPVLVADGEGFSELAMGSSRRGAAVSCLQGDAVKLLEYSFDDGLGAVITASQEPVLIQPPLFASSIVATGDDGLLLAYGGSREQVVLVSALEGNLTPKQSVLSSTILSVAEKRYEPSIIGALGGQLWIAWSAARENSTNLEVGITHGSILNNTPVFDATGTLLNVDTTGVQRRPRLASVGSGGVAAWISEQAGPLNRVALRRLDGAGAPAGDEVSVDEGADVLRDIGLAPIGGDRVAWVAERDAGVFRAGVRSAADLSKLQDTVFPSGEIARRYAPDLVAFDDRALLVSVGVVGTEARIRQAVLDGQGVLGAEVPVSTPVEKGTASPAVARLGPYWATVAWFDGTDERPSGVYLVFTAPTCLRGTVDCTDAEAPQVCVGFGPTGYVPLPGATAWCL